MDKNPFAEGENRLIRPPSTALVIFGASGDLTHRKLIPALYNLACDDYLPSGFVVIGASRTKLTDQEFRDRLFKSVTEHSRRAVDEKVWSSFAQNIFYQPLDGSKPEDFSLLRARLSDLQKKKKEDFNYLFYLATAPDHFGEIASNLKKEGLVEHPGQSFRATSLIVEKPFGEDLESARKLNQRLRRSFAEEQIFRIDHYLGKETVQNILVFRFANGIFEPVWNHNFVDHIQISVCEDIGVGNRAGYFDSTGIMRDIVQNHALQILALLCIEPPISLSDADSIRDEKVKVLKSMRRYTRESLAANVVRGQYQSGYVNGKEVSGYHEESGVEKDSLTETYVAMKLEIDNWRWSNVPIYIRAGKRLPRRITEITVYFKKPPEALFKGRQMDALAPNSLSIQIQPQEGISLNINSKPPGPRLRARPVKMDFSYGSSYGIASPEAYERLLLDAMKCDATLFTRDDEIEAAWDFLSPVLETWAGDRSTPLYYYEAGTWGPVEARGLLSLSGHTWQRF